MREAVDMANILLDGVNSDVNLKNHEIETNRYILNVNSPLMKASGACPLPHRWYLIPTKL
jgi:hypothetical protein